MVQWECVKVNTMVHGIERECHGLYPPPSPPYLHTSIKVVWVITLWFLLLLDLKNVLLLKPLNVFLLKIFWDSWIEAPIFSCHHIMGDSSSWFLCCASIFQDSGSHIRCILTDLESFHISTLNTICIRWN